MKKLTLQDFVDRARAVHGDRYGYAFSMYQSAHEKVMIHCPDHGMFEMTPANHIAGKGCSRCDIKLMKGDCLERMKEIPSGSVDMILTDPPYELSKSKGGGMMSGGRKFMQQVRDAGMIDGINTYSFLDSCLSMFDAKQKFCGVFTCSNRQVIEYISWAEENGFQYGIGVWQKTNPAPLCNCKYLNDVEYWIYIKGNKSKILGNYATKSMVYTSKVNKKDKDEFGHPTCKPVELMEKFIINHTSVGGVVFDPFMGSGSTGVACVNTGRKFIGIELDAGYFEIAKNRIGEALAKQD